MTPSKVKTPELTRTPMAQYLVLRDCFTEENRGYKRGQVVSLPESVYLEPKNFQEIVPRVQGEVAQVAGLPKTEAELAEEAEQAGKDANKTPELRTPAPGQFLCPLHRSIHRTNSAAGKRHSKHVAKE